MCSPSLDVIVSILVLNPIAALEFAQYSIFFILFSCRTPILASPLNAIQFPPAPKGSQTRGMHPQTHVQVGKELILHRYYTVLQMNRQPDVQFWWPVESGS